MSNTDIPSLPTGWEACCFGDIARIRNGYAFKSELFKKVRGHESDVPLIRQSQMKGARIDTSDAVFLSGDHLKKHSDYVITKGDVIIGMSGSIGKVCLYAEDFPALQNQRTGKIVPHLVSELNPKFFGLFLSNIERELTEFAKGMGVQNISAKDIEQLPFNLPPKNEQHRIVAKIEELFSELDKGIENLKTAQAQLKVYRQALLKHAFEGKLTVQWRAENQDKLENADALQKRIQQERVQRYQQQLADWQTNGGSKPKAPKSLPPLTAEELAELPELPEGWGWVRLGDILSVGSGSGLTSSQMNGGAFPVYGGNGISGYHDEYLFENETLILGRVGAKCGVVHITRPKSWITDNALIVEFLIHSLDQRYLKLRLEYLDLNKHSVSTAQPVISGSKIYPLFIGLPCLQEQIEIANQIESRLSEADQLDQTITTSLQQAEALRQSILKKAFSGLLVPQDPHDEPAAALLARIKAVREETSNRKTR